jgi:dienelactone hydrolase
LCNKESEERAGYLMKLALVLLYCGSLAATNVRDAGDKNALSKTLQHDLFTQLDARHERISALKTKAEWLGRQKAVKIALEELFGPYPASDLPAPVPKVTGELKHPSGFTVKKIIYETRPGLFVTGALWLPAGAGEKGSTKDKQFPAILLTSGHTYDAFRNNGSTLCTGPATNCTGPDKHAGGGGIPNPHKSFPANPGGYQLAQWNFVHRGFVVLAFDPIGQGERLEYTGEKEVEGGKAWGTFEHEYLARQLFLVGRSAASFWLYDEMRSIDLLTSLPYVNSSKIGATGCSGGGTQSSYIGANDPRIAAVSIACYMSTFEVDYEYAYGGQYDGEQTWPRSAVLDLDKPDLLEVRAPAPTQVLLTTEDNCFPARGGIAAVNESKSAFAEVTAAGSIGLQVSESVYHHGWVEPNRIAMYDFFQAALSADSGGGAPSKEWWPSGFGNLTGLWSPEQLRVTSTGQVKTAKECAPNLIYHDFTKQIAAPLEASLHQRRSASSSSSFLEEIRLAAPAVVGYVPPVAVLAVTHTADDGSPDSAEPTRVVLQGEGNCTLPVYIFGAAASATAARADAAKVLMYLTRNTASKNKEHLSRIQALVKAGYIVAAPSLCGLGELGDAFAGSYKAQAACPDMAQQLNRSIVGIHAADIVRVAQWVASGSSGDGGMGKVVATVAFDQLASAAIHAAVFSASASSTEKEGKHLASVGSVAVVGAVSSYASIVDSRHYNQDSHYASIFNVLSHYDLPDLLAAICQPTPHQRASLVLAPVDPMLSPLNSSQAGAAYQFPKSVCGSGGLAVVPGASNADATTAQLLKWLSAD